jgi:hypothetical protein
MPAQKSSPQLHTRARTAGTGGGAAIDPPDFERSVNHFSTSGTDYAHHITTRPLGFADLTTALELVSSIAKVSFFLVCPSYTLGCLKFDWISFLLEMVSNQSLIQTVKLVFLIC